MNTEKAIEICDKWFNYLDRQRDHSKRLAEAATLARNGEKLKAKQIARQVNMEKMVVFDGAYLEPAVKHLVKLYVPQQTTENGDKND